MYNETLIGIAITVVFGVASLVCGGNKFINNISQKTKDGNNTISNNTIGKDINNNKK